MLQPIIIALDFSSKEEVNRFLSSFRGEELFVKVGMELFYQEGPDLLRMLKDHGHHIFLDLKLHDIPTTVYKAMKGLAKLEVDLVNVHAMGGVEMMKRSIEGLEEGSLHNRPKCIAVTQLTSSTTAFINSELSIQGTVEQSVTKLASQAEIARLDGVVCSPLEVPLVRRNCRESFLTITPGIRTERDRLDDQKRVTTPLEAKKLGSNFIVVGRSITKAKDPFQTYQFIKEEWGTSYETTSR
ncbi:orotidine-5'-phosphate decarboxylase [Pseudalkalibacillus berkeleyi]|uniref:Orotidine 5'-phosphate decarboxylase n=1 Tax=Pseudalkalibacillus berkeleyi TaxID=1069813 RepID=A0ABS9GZM1_9BACL|nr:orotidine-5'-phosphate decarboxylase [Pseudalkalibacillus berkeleyi]MCF6137043.1 orotidine-5'-phosphate decarboxylase [Pseudalkalibacillus berkeleyi]